MAADLEMGQQLVPPDPEMELLMASDGAARWEDGEFRERPDLYLDEQEGGSHERGGYSRRTKEEEERSNFSLFLFQLKAETRQLVIGHK